MKTGFRESLLEDIKEVNMDVEKFYKDDQKKTTGVLGLITVYVPADFFTVIGSKPLLSMVTVLIIAIPMYVCATGSIPITLSLMLKGLSPGTALVLLMAGPAANFASFTLISREMGRKTAIIYLISIVIGAMTFGLIFDYVLPVDWFTIRNAQAMAGKEHAFRLLSTVSSAVLVILLVVTFIKGYKRKHINVSTMAKVLLLAIIYYFCITNLGAENHAANLRFVSYKSQTT